MPTRETNQRAPEAVLQEFQERFECWNRGELDRMQAMYAEDAIYDASRVSPDMGPMRGHEPMRRYWDEAWETWSGLRMDVREVFDVGNHRYVVGVQLWGRGRQSGAAVDQRFAFLYTLRPEDYLITRADLLPNVEEALALAGRSASAS